MSSFLNSSRFAAVGNSFSSKTTFASHESAHVENDALLASAAHSASKTSLDVVVVNVVAFVLSSLSLFLLLFVVSFSSKSTLSLLFFSDDDDSDDAFIVLARRGEEDIIKRFLFLFLFAKDDVFVVAWGCCSFLLSPNDNVFKKVVFIVVKNIVSKERGSEKHKNLLRCSYENACLFCFGMHACYVYISARVL
jgi:hypothetical protein